MQAQLQIAFCRELAELLAEQGSVIIENIGTFNIRRRPAYEGRNPEDGAWVEVPPTTLVFFKVALPFKSFLQNAEGEPPQARCEALVARVSERSGSPVEQVEQALRTWWREIAERAVMVDDSLDIELDVLGFLHVQQRPAEELSFGSGSFRASIPARRLVSFRPSEQLRSRLNRV